MTNEARVIVLTTEPPPLAGLATTGAGLRAWALAQGLKTAGHRDVTLVVASDAFAAQGAQVPPTPTGAPRVESVSRSQLRDWIRAQKPDVVVAQHWGLLNQVGSLSCPLAIDLAGPHLLERRLWGSPDPKADRREKLEMLGRADFVVCSGKSQRYYFMPYLLEAGFQLTSELCPVIPFSMPPDLPTPSPDRDFSRFVFGGFFLPWQDPEKPIRWLLDELDRRGKGSLEFFGGMHPTLDVSRGRFESLQDFVDSHPRVSRRGVVPFDEMVLAMRKCGAALDVMPPNLERELAFPSRTVVYLWAGLPVVHNNYDDLAPLIESYRAGWTLDPTDEKEFGRVIGRLVEHWEDVDRRSRGAQNLVREKLTWDKTITPLAAWTLDPRPRTGKTAVSLSQWEPAAASGVDADALIRAKAEIERLRGELDTVKGRKVVQIAHQSRELSSVFAPFVFLLAALMGVALFVLFVVADAVAALGGRRPKLALQSRNRRHVLKRRP